MNLYTTCAKQSFLDVVANFVVKNFTINNIDKLTIILPNGFACLDLQKKLIHKLKITILPNIIPFSDISIGGQRVLQSNPPNMNVTNTLEEQMILTDIIYHYPQFDFNINQSLKFSIQLIKLFNEFTYNNIPIESIQNIHPVNHAKHWQFIYEFLGYAYNHWQNHLQKCKMINQAAYHVQNLESLAKELQNNDNYIIIAGILGHNLISWNFLKQILSYANGFVILPHIPRTQVDNTIGTISDDSMYCINQLLQTLNIALCNIKLLGTSDYSSIFDELLIPTTKSKIKPSNILEYYEFDNTFDCIESMLHICKDNQNKQIAIIFNNVQTIEYYRNILHKYSLEFNDLFGENLLKINATKLLISISDLICNEFNLKTLFVLLKNPLIIADNIYKLEQYLLGKNRFINNYDQILELVNKSNDQHFVQWARDLICILKKHTIIIHSTDNAATIQNIKSTINEHHTNNSNYNQLHQILKQVITIAQSLCDEIWNTVNANTVTKFFNDLIKLNWNIKLTDVSLFPAILRTLLSQNKFFISNNDANITLCSPEIAILNNFDIIILADFSEDHWPPSVSANPLVSSNIQTLLGIHTDSIRQFNSLYHFYLLLHNQRIIITHSKQQIGGKYCLQSKYWLKLQLILQKNNISVKSNVQQLHHVQNDTSSQLHNLISHVAHIIPDLKFPSRISATDIEMLIRNPYGFYAKKILGLKKKLNFSADVQASEFGNFIHKVIEHYCKSYSRLNDNKLACITNISRQILSDSILPTYTKKIWHTRLTAIAHEFIIFDKERKRHTKSLHFETKGEMMLDICGHKISITSIADRIEIDLSGSATILDYKTGTLPSKQDVMSGLSPQLIIEALIALSGGFGMPINTIKSLIYVKIGSSTPYITTSELSLSLEELNKHRNGLKQLLAYYINNKIFDPQIDLQQYNDYKHLARIRLL